MPENILDDDAQTVHVTESQTPPFARSESRMCGFGTTWLSRSVKGKIALERKMAQRIVSRGTEGGQRSSSRSTSDFWSTHCVRLNEWDDPDELGPRQVP